MTFIESMRLAIGPITRPVEMTGTEQMVASFSESRCLISFAASSVMRVYPGRVEGVGGFGYQISPGLPPLIFSVWQHGPLVFAEWTISSATSQDILMVVEYFLPDDIKDMKRGQFIPPKPSIPSVFRVRDGRLHRRETGEQATSPISIFRPSRR